MGTPTKLIMIVAGEASGDMRAAGLARALKNLDPALRLSGIGGEHMRQAGVECFTDITELAVIGITEVIKNFSRIKKVFDQTLKQIDSSHPDCVILVDYPGFNLRLAREIKKRGLKIIYYISPQVWAWREKRILKIKKLVDRMIVLFPFEKDIYSKYGMKVDYVGHPLVDEIIVGCSRADVLKTIGLLSNKTTIGIMPGSRAKEVERHLPCMLEAAQKLFKQNHERQFILLRAPTIPMKIIEPILNENLYPKCHSRECGNLKHIPIKIYDGPAYDGINAMDAVIVASGTATLETALLEKPMVIIYKTSWLTYAIAKAVIKIPYIGLVNIVAGKKIAEELIQNEATAANIANAVERALKRPQIVDELSAVKTSLGKPGASLRAARVVLEEISIS
ncbi:MAG: lipid-A-disaccharide synthase [Candidatus Omnitrophica bacterium]|nr:lipid-A-disaccharide synthase [Candidatus Omnitrophota bacterium]